MPSRPTAIFLFLPVLALACGGKSDECVFYEDADGDGLGNPNESAVICNPEDGWVHDKSDCDDADPLAGGGLEETPYNGIDEDCDDEDAAKPESEDTGTQGSLDTGDENEGGPIDEDEDKDEGSCGCANGDSNGAWICLLLPLMAWRRRR